MRFSALKPSAGGFIRVWIRTVTGEHDADARMSAMDILGFYVWDCPDSCLWMEVGQPGTGKNAMLHVVPGRGGFAVGPGLCYRQS